jgi:4-hydroxybenzoate polyprenyltransferase
MQLYLGENVRRMIESGFQGKQETAMETVHSELGSKLKEFFGLSRMTHSVLDIAHPALGAILVFGGAPRPFTIVIGLLAAFSGYTAVFALNDILDCKVDCEKLGGYAGKRECFDLDSVGLRHPIAQGGIAMRAALGWVLVWGVLALGFAFLLNPVCSLLMAAAAGLEAGYCRLLRVTHWKTILSGLMVAVGGMAGVFAVTTSPPAAMVVLFGLWAFTWEMGCRNIPNDWSDLEEDQALRITTMPVRFGRLATSRISFVFACVTIVSSLLFPYAIPVRFALIFQAGALAAGIILLVIPGIRWLKDQQTKSAMLFFNRACFYPLAVFVIAGILVII